MDGVRERLKEPGGCPESRPSNNFEWKSESDSLIICIRGFFLSVGRETGKKKLSEMFSFGEHLSTVSKVTSTYSKCVDDMDYSRVRNRNKQIIAVK